VGLVSLSVEGGLVCWRNSDSTRQEAICSPTFGRKVSPRVIDVFFDNTGGDVLNAAHPHAMCGVRASLCRFSGVLGGSRPNLPSSTSIGSLQDTYPSTEKHR
jgi:hypothetical protein